MRKKYFTARYGIIAALLVMLLALCLAFGVCFTLPRAVYADDTAQEPSTEQPEDGEATGTEGEGGEDTPVPGKATNYWTVTPNLVSWKWGEFDSEINKISAEAAYGDIQFLIWHVKDADGNSVDEALTYEGYDGVIPNGSSATEKNEALFELDENGEMPEQVIEKLKTLDYGTYALIPTVAETDEYDGLGRDIDPNDDGYIFNVLKGKNSWTTSPYVIPWKWGEFSRLENLFTAVPAYFSAGDKVTFTVYKGITPLIEFNTVNGIMSNGAVTAEEEKVLKPLDAGNYYLRAYIEGTENYDALDTRVQFTIQTVQNHWLQTPNVVQWTWKEYNPEVNVISAVPAFPKTDAVVSYGIYIDRECKVPADDLLANFSSLTQERQEVIAALDAGTYYLEAETRYGSGNYTDLSSVISFTVQTVQNNWTTTPNVVQWKYGEYDSSVNLITAVPKHSNGSVTYGVYTDDAHTDAVDGLGSFTEINTDIAEKLDGLDAGTYYLYAYAAQAANSEQTPNFSKLETVVSFRIQQIQNYWTSTPSVLAWKFGEYDRAFNLISAVPANGTAHISVYDEDGITVGFVNDENKTVTSFELVSEDGGILVPEYVGKRLVQLNAGTYYMLATVEGGDNFTALNDYTETDDIKAHAIKFEVSTVTNSWTDIPKVLGWNEGHFTDENKIFAKAAYGNDKMVVIVYDADNKVITSNQNNTQLDYDKIASLGVGTYKVSFRIDETDNYSALSGEIEFSVMEDSIALSGIIAASITFAVLDVIAAAVCITLLVIRRRKIEEQFRKMISKELRRS